MRVRFDHIARECRNTHKGSVVDIPIVGLEHIEPYDMLLKNHDMNVETTFSKTFKKGQVLFGRRRAYQHKACVATFDGICSGDITVIEPIEGAVFPNLLPFIVQNDDFFEHAIKGSNGALSPRVKWEHMANYEVNLPPISEQKVLADKLWAAYEVKQSYLKMIEATDEMVKAQFVEVFGNPFKNDKKWVEYGKIGRYAQIILGSTPDSKNLDYWNGSIKWITPAEMTEESYFIFDTERHLSEMGLKAANLTLLPERSVLFSTRAPIGKVGLVGSKMYCNQGFKNFICGEKLNPVFLYYTLIYNRDYLVSLGTGTTFKELSKRAVEDIELAIPDMDLQNRFEQIYNHSYNTKAELRKSIEAIDKVVKSLINYISHK